MLFVRSQVIHQIRVPWMYSALDVIDQSSYQSTGTRGPYPRLMLAVHAVKDERIGTQTSPTGGGGMGGVE